MSIIIGGPPSSGSSLLATTLNKHSNIACFQETHLLAKNQLYVNWDTYKSRLQKGRLMSPGWHMYNKLDASKPIKDFKAQIASAVSVYDFAAVYFSSIAKHNGKQQWGEKTPGNVYFFHNMNSLAPTARFILTIRNPYDTIASLTLRGRTILDSLALTLLNLAIGQLQSQRLEVFNFIYEDFVVDPESTLRELCQFVQVEYESSQLKSLRKPKTKMKGWKHYEDGPIETSSLDRFDELSIEVQKQIIHLAERVYINPNHLLKYGIIQANNSMSAINLLSLIKYFNYDIKEQTETGSHLNPSFLKDRLNRLIRLHPTAFTYPIYYE